MLAYNLGFSLFFIHRARARDRAEAKQRRGHALRSSGYIIFIGRMSATEPKRSEGEVEHCVVAVTISL